ncbi:MAG: 4-alpha-glucanotransferase, partial [Methylocystaceae bacterium]
MSRRVSEGAPEPLGVTLDAAGANIAVYSAHAEAIDLCLFDDAGEIEIERLRLPARTGDIFHAHVEGVREDRRYGLRAHGPYAPQRGHRFNAAKLLVDPYALAIDRAFALHPSMFDHRTDSAPFVPKGVVTRPRAADASARPKRRWDETIIYELHVRGFTKRLKGVPEPLRGTFAGLAHEAAIDHLAKLGVTAVEIMPAAAWVDERHLAASGLANYWGYNPIAMMAPDPRLAPGGWAEVTAAVAALHAAGLEVVVDAVFNHTGEGDEFGPILSLRGLDNAAYYRLQPDDPRRYRNDAGCGNILALDRPHVVRYVMDALRAWATYAGVDGFRFDLATTLARREGGFDADAPLLAAISQDPLLRDLKLIAEPWDIGPGGYRLGGFPAAWGEWNDRFRDAARRFWRGDDVGVG